MEFYEIESPTTKQIFDAIINNEYVPLEKIQSKAKQINILLLDYYNTDEIYITFSGMTNCGGVPHFLPGYDLDFYSLASEVYDDFYEMTEDEQDNVIELFGCYLQSYNNIFNI